MTNKELQELLKQYPDAAKIRVDVLDSFGDLEINYVAANRVTLDSKNEEIIIDAT